VAASNAEPWTRRHARLAWAAVAGLSVLALGVRLPLMSDSLFGDELFAYSEVRVADPLGVVRSVTKSIEVTPPLFFILAWASTKLGDPTVWVRLPSLLAGVGLIPLLYLLGRQTVGALPGVLAAALAAVAPSAVHFSAEARPYAMLMFGVALSTYALVRAVGNGRRRWWLVYAGATLAVIYTHYTGILALGAQAAWAAWRHPRSRKRLAAANASALLLFLPWLPQVHSKGQLENPFYSAPLSPANIGRSLLQVFPGHPSPSLPPKRLPGISALVAVGAVFVAAAVMSGVGAGRVGARPGRREAHVVLLVLIVVFVPVGVYVTSLMSGHNIFQPRYLTSAFPAAMLLIGWLVSRVRRPAAVALALVILAAVGVGTRATLRDSSRPAAFREAARDITARAGQRDVVVQQPGHASGPLSEALVIYLPRHLHVVRVNGARRTGSGFEATVDPAVWSRAVAGGRVWVVGPEAPPVYRLPRPPARVRSRVREILHRRYPGVTPIDLYAYGARG
jgi:mannosyltransferase